jgi:hypothetical protein
MNEAYSSADMPKKRQSPPLGRRSFSGVAYRSDKRLDVDPEARKIET